MAVPDLFKEWLKAQVHRDDPVGEFAKSALDDPAAPRGSYNHWRHYLTATHVSGGVVEAFESAWKEFSKRKEETYSLFDNLLTRKRH